MKRTRGRARLVISSIVLVITGGGCSLIVGDSVEDVQCSGDSTSACPPGMICNSSGHCVTGEIIPPDPDSGDDDASTADVVDAGKDTSAPLVPQELGAKCRVDTDCKSLLCGASNILTTTIVASTGPICTTTCCTSMNCPNGLVCFNGGTGGGYCVPSALAHRTPPATGGKSGGVTCSSDTECRSGLCTGTPKRCLDTCCADAQCAAGSVCSVLNVTAPAPAHDTWVCAAPTGTLDVGAPCSTQGECKSLACISGTCRPPCSSNAACTAVPGYETGHCRYITTGSDYFKACQKTTGSSEGDIGDTCAFSTDCNEDYCDGESKSCANVCSTDADCTSSQTCRPAATGTPFLRCVSKR